MADMCAYCSLDTGGNHEMECPLRWQPLAGSDSNWPAAAPKMNYQGHLLAGSGYDQGFKAGQKQGGAEVLAAVLENLRLVVYSPNWTPEEFFQAVEAYVRTVQPAASALEVYVKNLPLSEIARIKGLYALASVNKAEEE